jgi:hypothetical protein
MSTAFREAREADLGRKHEAYAKGREIGDIPPVAHPRRKKVASRDFRKFCGSYFPQTFDLAWSDDHLKVIGQIEESVLHGGLFATAMPRGSGKTSLAEVAAIWADLYGHRQFVVLIGSDEKRASEMLESIKTDLETNELLLEDFPEVVYPIRCLEGIAHRCNGQIHKGERTLIGWTADEIVTPTIPGSKASGAVMRVTGITGGIRGMKYKRADGRTVRPDLVIVDDPQTDQSARSPSQCETRERILAGAILGLAGPGKKISGIMPCTVIRPDDMADRMLDRQKHPEWNGTRTKMVYSFPVNEKLWEEYSRIRADSLRAERGGVEATEFYAANRAAMDEGARVAWEARRNPDELSAIQHAMNLKLRDERAFFAEYQNEPLVEEESRGDDLTADMVMSKINRMGRGVVPISCNRVTAFVDVQASLLWYAAVAWEDDFTGYVIDYGAYPDQHSPYFTLRDAKITLATIFKATGLEGQIYGGLEALTGPLLAREWPRDDGASLKVERCMVDANWGSSTDTIYQFCRQSAHSTLLLPSHGKYVGAASMPMREYTKKPGDKVGLNWRMPNVQGRRAVRYAIYDTNFWKSFVHGRLSVAMGDRGCLSIFGDRPDQHRMLADQLCSEYRVRTTGRGREVDEWKLRPERPDNHLLDCLVGCAVAASIQGVALAESGEAAPEKVKRVSFAELQRRRNGKTTDQARA